MEKLRAKWAKSEEQKDARRSMLNAAMAAGALRTEERRKAFHSSWHGLLEHNKDKLHEGTFKAQIVPIDFVEPEDTGARSKRQKVVEEVGSFLNLGV